MSRKRTNYVAAALADSAVAEVTHCVLSLSVMNVIAVL